MRHVLFSLLFLTLSTPALADTPPRAEVPIREVDLASGVRRYVVTLTIDGQSVDVGLDTGSTGLRVLPRGLGPVGRAARGERARYSYGSGTAFAGPAIRVQIGIGAVAGTIRIMRIDEVGCRAQRPDCAAGHTDLTRFGIQGDGIPGQGFAAILGIRLQDDAVGNPFLALGVKRWIVELPHPGKTDGRLILDPDDTEVAAYRRVALDDAGTTPGCLVGPAAQGRICAPAYFDTGAPGLHVLAVHPPAPWPSGAAATLMVGEGASVQSAAIEIGRRDQATGMFSVPQPNARRTTLSLGLAPYFIWSVLYDAGRHEIGLRPR